MKKIFVVLVVFVLSAAAIAGYNFLGAEKVSNPSLNTAALVALITEQNENVLDIENDVDKSVQGQQEKSSQDKSNEEVLNTLEDTSGNPPVSFVDNMSGEKPNNVQNLSTEQKPNEVQGQDKNIGQANGNVQALPNRKVDPTKPMVALTFDDGPHPKYTERILKALEKHNGRATFFVVGNLIPKNESIIKKMAEQGNQIGNHSYNHKDLTTLNATAIKSQMQKTDALIKKITGYTPDIMRPTYGSVNNVVRKSVDMPMIMWSIDTEDWKTRNTKKIVNHVMSKVQDGDIVLMHDIHQTTAEAAEIVVEKLSKQGYQLVTIEELFEYRDIKLQDGKSYRSAYKKK